MMAGYAIVALACRSMAASISPSTSAAIRYPRVRRSAFPVIGSEFPCYADIVPC
jgi:hypothetical protein